MAVASEVASAPGVFIDPSAFIDDYVMIYPSVRGSCLTLGPRTRVGPFTVIRFVGGAGDIEVGEGTCIGSQCHLLSGHGIRLGKMVNISGGVALVPVNHAFARRDVPMIGQGFMPSRGGLVVDDDVWIGSRCVLLDGTHIEQGAIIGAGSVVRGRVPAYQIWAGNPARYVKDRP